MSDNLDEDKEVPSKLKGAVAATTLEIRRQIDSGVKPEGAHAVSTFEQREENTAKLPTAQVKPYDANTPDLKGAVAATTFEMRRQIDESTAAAELASAPAKSHDPIPSLPLAFDPKERKVHPLDMGEVPMLGALHRSKVIQNGPEFPKKVEKQ